MEEARAALAEVKANQKFWYGDFCPLTWAANGPDAFAAWQLHRSDLDAGIVLAFRRSQCPYPVLQVELRGLEPAGRYSTAELIDEGRAVQRHNLLGREQ